MLPLETVFSGKDLTSTHAHQQGNLLFQSLSLEAITLSNEHPYNQIKREYLNNIFKLRELGSNDEE